MLTISNEQLMTMSPERPRRQQPVLAAWAPSYHHSTKGQRNESTSEVITDGSRTRENGFRVSVVILVCPDSYDRILCLSCPLSAAREEACS